jgi:hypothetical protein
MVLRVVAGVVAGVVTGVVVGVVTRGDEVNQHHSSAWVVAGGVCAHLNARGLLLPSCSGKKTLPLHGGRHWSLPTWPYTRVRLPPPGR